ncbi:hypothetical protein N9230_03560 [Akkermansiaceae bacterium]|nr:hypothetical protein [Akkermansiaceae bacterium]
MSKLIKMFLWSCLLSLTCQGQEKEKVTQKQDKLTLERARIALAESKKGSGEISVSLFDLPESILPEIIDTKLTYRKALEALKRQDAEVKELTALVSEKRGLLAKMVGKTFREDGEGKMRVVPNPPYTEKQYDEAKAAYEKAQEELHKAKAPSEKRVLFKKTS